MLKRLLFFPLLLTFFICQGQLTKLTVRAKSKDAKFIGTSIGGAFVVIRNNLTGEILAQGLTSGSTGNSNIIMKNPIARRQNLSDDETAKFEAFLNITEPTFLDIEVIAPVNRRNSTVKATTQTWLVPGKDIIGDGIVVEIPGFVLDIINPTTHRVTSLESLPDKQLTIKASLTMTCGCPVTKGGLWNSEDITVNAIIRKEGEKTQEVPLQFSGTANIFEGNFGVSEKGMYQIDVYAFDPKTGNTGVDKVNIIIN